ncbi:hypothetical protein SAMN05444340_11532 [Citreimonas salinaria]|uniref:Uncharacterized protein n=2 Tax=Citreimonas salinaria TaxID=321339 RepID=A0A1H3M0H7_9RHOB|nr:hypothetical protein SAMN05444340_11532 [Citreimonas salinaria]
MRSFRSQADQAFNNVIAGGLSPFAGGYFTTEVDVRTSIVYRYVPGLKAPQRVAHAFAFDGVKHLRAASLEFRIAPLADQGPYLSVEDICNDVVAENIFLTIDRSSIRDQPIRMKPIFTEKKGVLVGYRGFRETGAYKIYAGLNRLPYYLGRDWTFYFRITTNT